MRCPRCGIPAEPAGFEDGRAYFECPQCRRVWPALIQPDPTAVGPRSTPLPRVLLVDDSEQLLQLLAFWLEEEPCVTITATSGREALDLASGFAPQVAFVDLVLPPPDGWRVCECLQQLFRTEVILMTGVPSPAVRLRAEEAGMTLLQKPLTEEDVLSTLRHALARRPVASR